MTICVTWFAVQSPLHDPLVVKTTDSESKHDDDCQFKQQILEILGALDNEILGNIRDERVRTKYRNLSTSAIEDLLRSSEGFSVSEMLIVGASLRVKLLIKEIKQDAAHSVIFDSIKQFSNSIAKEVVCLDAINTKDGLELKAHLDVLSEQAGDLEMELVR